MTVEQGELGLTDTVIKNNSVYGSVTIVSLLRFRNASSYVLTLSRYSKKSNRTDIIYQYTLSAGDNVLDATQYLLNYGDILYAKSSVTGTSYVANVQ